MTVQHFPPPETDELTVTIFVDNATTRSLASTRGLLRYRNLENICWAASPRGERDGHACVVPFGLLCVACHGFSTLAGGPNGKSTARRRTPLRGLAANAKRLAFDLSSIEVLFLSHSHWDHSGGITSIGGNRHGQSKRRSAPVRGRHSSRPDRPACIITPFGIFAMPALEPTVEAIVDPTDDRFNSADSGAGPAARANAAHRIELRQQVQHAAEVVAHAEARRIGGLFP